MADDSEYYKPNASEKLITLSNYLHKLLPIILLLLILVLPIKLLTGYKHILLTVSEFIIIGFFMAEVGVNFFLFESKKQFLKQNWLNILLILPFLAVFRTVGTAAQVLRGAQAVEILGASGFVRELTAVSRFAATLGEIQYVQKIAHLLKDGKLVLKKYISSKQLGLLGLFSIGAKNQTDDNNQNN